MLAGESLIISEFLTDNRGTKADIDGDFSDWIEIHNPSDQIFNLEGWHLTDDPTDLTKWGFPANNINSGNYEFVFASGKDRSQRRMELHTNFKLSSEGEFLALVKPDGTIAHQYSPKYEQQFPDVSYGIPSENFSLIANETQAAYLVPRDDSFATSWTLLSFLVDQELWSTGDVPLSFGLQLPSLDVSGFTVRQIHSVNRIDNLADADALVAGTGILSETTTHGISLIDYFDNSNSEGNFQLNHVFPNGGGDHFVLTATATLKVETAGVYTFGAHHDNGGRLVIDGEVIFEDEGEQTAHEILASGLELTAGNHTLEYMMYETGRGALAELFVAPGRQRTFNNTFKLLGDPEIDGLKVFAITERSTTTDIADHMRDISSSVYLRIPFEISEEDIIETLLLQMQYSDAFIAYLNGVEVARSNLQGEPAWNSISSENRPLSEILVSETFDITAMKNLLLSGENVLAVHAISSSTDDDTFLISPEIVGSGQLLSRPSFFETSTPDKKNSAPLKGFVAEPEANFDSGFYESRIRVEITSETPDTIIRYTIDGSEPNDTQGLLYSSPIVIRKTTALRFRATRAGFHDSLIQSRTYIFLDDVIHQTGQGLPTTWGTATANYEMDRRVVNDPRYRDTIKDDLRAIPTLSLVMEPDDLWDSSRGIYANSTQSGINWERPVSVELLSKDGTSEFQVNAGVRIHGGASRNPGNTNKHSFRLLFKNIYGPGKLNYPMFGEDATDEFDTFVLRANFNSTWATGDPNAPFIQDRWVAQSQADMGGLAPHGVWVHLYLNGTYWGLYNPNERPNASFAASYLGGEREDYNAYVTGENIDGDNVSWNRLNNLTSQPVVDYEAVQELLDIPAFIDYMMVNQFGGNGDWPQNNWYASQKRDGGKWMFHSWDAEFALRGVSDDTRISSPGGPGNIFLGLRSVDAFNRQFTNRIQLHMFNGGTLTPEANIARLDALAKPIDRAIVGESARWGDGSLGSTGAPRTRDDNWLPRLESLRTQYFQQRNDFVIAQYRFAELYPLVDASMFIVGRNLQHGGRISPNDRITITGEGRGVKIYFTLDGSDIILADGTLNPEAILYGGPFTISETSRIKTQLHVGNIWTAQVEALFFVEDPPTADNLAITEISYHPSASTESESARGFANSDDFEFIELQNIGGTTVDLHGTRFTTGISFEFSDSETTRLEPGEYIVLANNLEAFEHRYGRDIRISGQYTGRLDNAGEQLTLVNRNDEIIADFSYNDKSPWPIEADGEGPTLELIDPAFDPAVGQSWRSSLIDGGSPGVAGDLPVDIPPQIVALVVGSSRWKPDFTDQLTGDGLNRLSTSSKPIPWSNIDQLHVTFSTDITISAGDLSLTGSNNAVIDFIPELYDYSRETHTVSWTFIKPLPIDRYLVQIKDTVQDVNGIALDGEWDTVDDDYPSGDGVPGGDFIFQFSVLPGDIDQSGIVDNRDVQLLREAGLSSLGSPTYSSLYDINGSGTLDIRDLQSLRNNLLAALDEIEPLVPDMSQARRDEIDIIFADLSSEEAVHKKPTKISDDTFTPDSVDRLLSAEDIL